MAILLDSVGGIKILKNRFDKAFKLSNAIRAWLCTHHFAFDNHLIITSCIRILLQIYFDFVTQLYLR